MNAGNGKHTAILNVTLDCADARAQASFWAGALGWIAQEQDDAPNRLHLDLIPPGGDPQQQLTRLVGLGATVLDSQPRGAGWLILADPEGNEFCLEGAGAD
jgi:catechol 2,3-dioxygenase-like lactoylglutathione lyase family enzyme